MLRFLSALVVVSGLYGQNSELRSPDDVLNVREFRQWQQKKNRVPKNLFTTPRWKIEPVLELAPGPCSIPLLTIKPRAMDRAIAIQPPKVASNMPQIAVPAPPCKD